MTGTVVAAVDFGATSIRVARVDLGTVPPRIEVVHRYRHEPVGLPDGSVRWNWDRLVAETLVGLEAAVAAGPVASIGVDTWAVDYGLVDRSGRLLSAPHSYRSHRTDDYLEVVDRLGAERLYGITGTQVQPFNTIFQLAAHDRDELATADRLLLLPDLLIQELTGGIPVSSAVAVDRTGAGATGLLDLATGDWSGELLDAIGVPRSLMPPVLEPGTRAGTWRGIPVIRVGGHDTASAVAAMGPRGGASVGFVCTGTWLLVGREQPTPDTTEAARVANFTNEQAVGGGIRLLKNVAGFWMVNECARAWGSDPVALLDVAAEVAADDVVTFDATDPRFFAPGDMEAELRSAAGFGPEVARAVVIRSAVESMAATTAEVLDGLGGITEVTLVGGGAGSALLRTAIEAHSGLPVTVGPTEAACLGNALTQGIALGCFTDLADARARALGAGC